MLRLPTNRAPTHPGVMLRQEFLEPHGITQRKLAVELHLPYQRVNEVVRARRGVTVDTALRLARFFDTSPEFWISLQVHWDVYHAQRAHAGQLERIRPFVPPPEA